MNFFPANTLRLLLSELLVTISSEPSPLRSAAAIRHAPGPTGIEAAGLSTASIAQQHTDAVARGRNDVHRRIAIHIGEDFRHPYTKIEFVEEELGVTRKTASQYLKQLVEKDYLKLLKIGRSNFYLNAPLFDLFVGTRHGGDQPSEAL